MKHLHNLIRSAKYLLSTIVALTFISHPPVARSSDADSFAGRKALQRVIAQTIPQAKLTFPLEPGGGLGTSVAISGNTALVGAPYDRSDAGSAYVFVYDGTQWIYEEEFSDGLPGAFSGFSVSLSGDTALIGVPGYGTSQPGAAVVFVRSGKTWLETAVLTASDGANDNYFGASVSLRGGTALIGAPGGATGEAYVFSGSGSSWTQQAILKQSGVESFGTAVSLGEGRALIGGASNLQSQQNIAYIYSLSGTQWTLQASLTPPGNEDTDFFGQSVSLDGDQALIGAPGVNFFGAGYIYTFDGTSWTLQQELVATDQPDNSELGSSVALLGRRALLGAPGAGNDYTGSALLFTSNGTTWTQSKTLTAPSGMPMDEFGTSVALGGRHVLVGAPGETETNPDDGAAYIFGR